MDLKYIVMTIIKILVSVPTCMLLLVEGKEGALMGGHLDNDRTNLTKNITISTSESDTGINEIYKNKNTSFKDEFIPNPSPLISPGYNLPENIFNKGKPFYLEKNPVTGKVDFKNESSYSVKEDTVKNIGEFDKTYIDQEDDDLISSHRPSDVNQLIPNFHDFLNLPVKYNSDKYSYPLISSSYANTKVQGYTHKQYGNKKFSTVIEKMSTDKPTQNTTYYNSNLYFSTEVKTTTVASLPTKKLFSSSQKQEVTTKASYNLFDMLFGNYDENVSNFKQENSDLLEDRLETIDKTEESFIKDNHTTIHKEKPNYTKTELNGKDKNITTSVHKNNHFEKLKNVETVNSYMKSNISPYDSKENSSKIDNYDYEYYEDIEEDNLESDPLSLKSHSNQTSSNDDVTNLLTNNNSKERNKNSNGVLSTTSKPQVSVSVPLGNNYINRIQNNDPIIVAAHNLKEKLSNEKVDHDTSNKNNIEVNEDQYTAPFFVEKYQNNALNNLKEVHNFQAEDIKNVMTFQKYYNIVDKNKSNNSKEINDKFNATEPIENIFNDFEQSDKESMTEKLDMKKDNATQEQTSKKTEIKKVLPNSALYEGKHQINNNLKITQETASTEMYFKENIGLHPPPLIQHKEVLLLHSKPIYHQLTSDLTPPIKDQITRYPQLIRDKSRPPWDPRPGHFYSGEPEYAHPPRPLMSQPSTLDIQYKRVDNLPNILPQFRPNMNIGKKNYVDNDKKRRPPLFELQTNKPIEFYERLQPPPRSPEIMYNYNDNIQMNLHNLAHEEPQQNKKIIQNKSNQIENKLKDQFGIYQKPPLILIANKRIGSDSEDVETLQMLQAKNGDKKENSIFNSERKKYNLTILKDHTDRPLYVVYPINASPIKLDLLDNHDKESVVIGTRAEEPLPPSKINKKFNNYKENQALHGKNRDDLPVLIPHQRVPIIGSIKSDFPYPLERPITPHNDFSKENNNNTTKQNITIFNNWNLNNLNNTIKFKQNPESDISVSNQIISVTLKTYTEKPIAVAYTPTESPIITSNYEKQKFSRPNFGSSVIPEIRHDQIFIENDASAYPNIPKTNNISPTPSPITHHKLPKDDIHIYDKFNKNQENFQAPFQASANINSMNQGWSIVKSDIEKRNKEDDAETTTMQIITTSEFDIENFNPQMEGGFKPILNFSFSNDRKSTLPLKTNNR